MNPVTSFLVVVCVLVAAAVGYLVNPYLAFVFLAAGAVIATSLKMANVWQKFVVLRMGKLQGVKGTGMFAIIPIIDSIVAVIGRFDLAALDVSRRFGRLRRLRFGRDR